MKKYCLSLFLLFTVFLSACGGEVTAPVTETPTVATSTPDLCSEEFLPDEVAKIHKLTREFDDYSALASNTPQQQLVAVIPDLQRVLRNAEDQVVPACLTDLKKLQVTHMQTVVQTLLGFLGNADASAVSNGISKARDLHAQYDIEMARLLGVTLTVITQTPVLPTTIVEPTSTPVLSVTNSGPNDLNLRKTPDFNSPASTVLASGESVIAVGRTADSQWIQVLSPENTGEYVWVYTTVVSFSFPVASLPIVTP